MKLKFKNIILVSLLGIVGLFGVTSTLIQNDLNVQVAKADSTVNIYINTQNWGDDVSGVWYYTWSWETGKSGAWYDFTKVEDHIYKVSVPQANKNFQFFRAGSGMSHGWTVNTNYWNKTGDLSASSNLFYFTEYSAGNWNSYYKDSYIYYISDKKEATLNKIYSWGYSEQFGAWSGTNITSLGDVTEVHGTVHFDGNEVMIYRIPYATSGYGGFKFNYNGGDQSGDKTFSAGGAYTWGSNNSAQAGLALELILDIESARNAATYQGHSWSICGISKSAANGFVKRFDALGTDGKNYVNNSTTYTYVDNVSWNQDNISYAEIINRLRVIASGGYGAIRIFSPLSLFGDSEDNLSTIIIIVASSVALLSVTALSVLILKKRKRKEQE